MPIKLPEDYPFRESDIYGLQLLDNVVDARNELRTIQPEQSLITKRLEPTVSWL